MYIYIYICILYYTYIYRYVHMYMYMCILYQVVSRAYAELWIVELLCDLVYYRNSPIAGHPFGLQVRWETLEDPKTSNDPEP